MEKNDTQNAAKDECVVPSHPVPPSELTRYSVERDPHSEQDIARYVEIETHDEKVEHVEKVKQEVVLGGVYEMWTSRLIRTVGGSSLTSQIYILRNIFQASTTRFRSISVS
jgi:hypothetical protein